jgi:predicted nucleotide-binding protein
VAYTYGLPILIVAEEGIEPRVLFNWNVGPEITVLPTDAAPDWLKSESFRNPFANWVNQLENRRDVFLGYSSASSGIAANIKRYLKGDDLNVTVLDWRKDFAPAQTILQQITEAGARCSGGIFLFTQDDKLTDDADTHKAVPRDNVVFEAGYFLHAKGKERVLIVLEEGAKMLGDLGGDVYISLTDKTNIEPLEYALKQFVEQRL